MGAEPYLEHLPAAQQLLLVAAQPVPAEPPVLLLAAASQLQVPQRAQPALPAQQSQVQYEVARAVFEHEQLKREVRSRYNCRRSTT
jgi:hypothetical protein